MKKKQQFNKNNVLVIGDTHIPYELDGYLKFVKKIQKQYDCGTIVHIGDLADFHGLSYHEKDPDLPSAGSELELLRKKLKPWYRAFPNMYLCMGNHDRLPARKAKTLGLPGRFMKSLKTVLGAPDGWEWGHSFIINNTLYYHGDGTITPTTSIKKALSNSINTVHGHAHSNAGAYYIATEGRLTWAMNVGCGVDRSKKAFDYQKFVNVKPVIGCGVVIGKKSPLPIFIPMDLGSKWKFNYSKRRG